MRQIIKDNIESKYIVLIICVILLALCFGVVAPKLSDAETYSELTKSLDEKRGTAIEMSAVLTGASIVIASVPGDSTTPIADQIAGMNSYLIVVIAAIMLEKYMLPIIGMFVSYILIPAAIIMVAVYVLFKKRLMLNIAVLCTVVAVALMMVVPVCINVGNKIDEAYGMSTLTSRIQEDLKTLNKDTSDDKKDSSSEKESSSKKKSSSDKKSSSKKSTSSKTDSKSSKKKDSGIWNQVKDFFSDTAEDITEDLTETATVGIENIKVVLGDFMDAIAALIISTCVVPIIICVAFYWIAKMVFSYLIKLISPSKDELPQAM